MTGIMTRAMFSPMTPVFIHSVLIPTFVSLIVIIFLLYIYLSKEIIPKFLSTILNRIIKIFENNEIIEFNLLDLEIFLMYFI
jgi:Cu/Ag efflux pump CusA